MKEALKLALEALEASAPWVELTNEAITNDRAIADIKEALAQPAQEPWPEEPFGHMAGGVQPPQEPWRESASDYERGFIDGRQKQAQSSVDKAVNRMAQRTWVSFTDEEVDQFHNWKNKTWSTNELVRHVEAALRSKNT